MIERSKSCPRVWFRPRGVHTVPRLPGCGEVEEAFRTLPERYLGAEPGFDATYHVRLGDVGHTWEVRATDARRPRAQGRHRAASPTSSSAPTPATWLALREGELSGIEAFSQRRLRARGDLDLAVAFEGLFRLPERPPAAAALHDVPVARQRIADRRRSRGDGPDVLLLHGLGATKTSFFDTAAALRHEGYRVHAIDLPGFGSSSKPASRPTPRAGSPRPSST